MSQCQCQHQQLLGPCALSTHSQLVSKSINSVSLKLAVSAKWQRSPCHVTHQEKWLFGCLWFRSRIRAQNKLSEVESSWICTMSSPSSLPCINPQAASQALICTVSWNQWKSTEPLGPELEQTDCSQVEKEGKKSSGLSLACLFPVAC